MKARFVLNERTHIVHKFPTREDCNCDQIPRKNKKFLKSLTEAKGARRCGRCLARR